MPCDEGDVGAGDAQEYVTEPVAPLTFPVAMPLQSPKQSSVLDVVVMVTEKVAATEKVALLVQPFASVAVTVPVPPHNPVALGPVAPLDQL